MSVARNGCTAVTAGNKAFFVGGIDNNQQRYTEKKWTYTMLQRMNGLSLN